MARTAKVVSCDEQTRQALEGIARSHSEEARLVRRAKMVLGCLDGAIEVAAGTIHGKTVNTKRRVDFLAFMDDLLKELVADDTLEYHVILDNYCIHKRCDAWLQTHPNVFFYYTPTSASWLNMVEIWFNIMSRKVLRGASFDSTGTLAEAISGYINAYNEMAKPFVWKKRGIKGSQIKNNLSNLCG